MYVVWMYSFVCPMFVQCLCTYVCECFLFGFIFGLCMFMSMCTQRMVCIMSMYAYGLVMHRCVCVWLPGTCVLV